MTNDETCEHCKHFELIGAKKDWMVIEAKDGNCHLHPPVVLFVINRVQSCFAQVYANDWCNDFERHI